MMKKVFFLMLSLSFLVGMIGCDKDNGLSGSKAGSVKGVDGVPVESAYIFTNDSLLAQTDAEGMYPLLYLDPGTYTILCSGLYYKDTTMEVTVLEGEAVNLNFVLTPDSSIGRVCGEFQDGTLWNQAITENPDILNWAAKYVCDANTGATLQAKWLDPEGTEPIYSEVYLGDQFMDSSDMWGQYLFKIQAGTYPFTGVCAGHKNQTKIIKVSADEKVYLNFVLPRTE